MNTKNIWSDEYLRETIATCQTSARGLRAQCEMLLTVPEEVRLGIYAEAGTLGNLRAGYRHSDNLRDAIGVWRGTGRFPQTERAEQERRALQRQW